jgi:AraC-like DNA-binding protein
MKETELENLLLATLHRTNAAALDPRALRDLCASGLRASSRSCVALATLLRADRLRAFTDPEATLLALDALQRASADVLGGDTLALLYEVKAGEYLKLGRPIQALDCSLRALKMPQKSPEIELRCLRWVATCQLLVGEVTEAVVQLESVCLARIDSKTSIETQCGIYLQAAFARWVAALAKEGRFTCYWSVVAAASVDVDTTAKHLAQMRHWLEAAGSPEFGTDGYYFLCCYRALLEAIEQGPKPALSGMQRLIRELASRDSYLAQRMTIEMISIARWGGELALARNLLAALPKQTTARGGLLAVMVLHEQLWLALASGDTSTAASLAERLFSARAASCFGVGSLLQGALSFTMHTDVGVPRQIAALRERLREEKSMAVPLSRILDEFGMSRRSVELGFQKHVGRSPAEFRLAARLDIAKNLLRETQLSVQEIAERIGFSSASTLGASYRRVYGKSPSDERIG